MHIVGKKGCEQILDKPVNNRSCQKWKLRARKEIEKLGLQYYGIFNQLHTRAYLLNHKGKISDVGALEDEGRAVVVDLELGVLIEKEVYQCEINRYSTNWRSFSGI